MIFTEGTNGMKMKLTLSSLYVKTVSLSCFYVIFCFYYETKNNNKDHIDLIANYLDNKSKDTKHINVPHNIYCYQEFEHKAVGDTSSAHN